jgi:hypothetical protein
MMILLKLKVNASPIYLEMVLAETEVLVISFDALLYFICSFCMRYFYDIGVGTVANSFRYYFGYQWQNKSSTITKRGGTPQQTFGLYTVGWCFFSPKQHYWGLRCLLILH